MALVKAHNRWVILMSFLAALVAMSYPISTTGIWLRPELIPMLVIYWIMVLPQQSSILQIWCVGCIQDLLQGTPLGLHAMALMVVAYVCLLSYQRMRNYTIWHQTFFVFVIVGLHQLVDSWVHSLQGSAAQTLVFLLPAFTSALLWPLLWMVLERLRVGYRIT
ncbi:rod shape-determining protein MreD [Pseudomaricurvus alkylphenolicus]|uniref:rod shape-determining protein MreD n=1 Tax=Pseudomaricurvus alkylphenolicus TaxID=1306991 RepID=UPI001421A423|nr:rod shape-determining protein MreD [Pseudomaricurvus alkylphenolicus]NIB41848.1 rod shape-determining protein MreD [Pseudomaricurvus alkylphenolicus]